MSLDNALAAYENVLYELILIKPKYQNYVIFPDLQNDSESCKYALWVWSFELPNNFFGLFKRLLVIVLP